MDETKGAKPLEIVGSVSVSIMSDGVYLSFREEPKTDDGWASTVNLPFAIYEKFKANKVKITVSKAE